MLKKILIFFLFFQITGCGFAPMLKNFDVSKIKIEKINFSGKNELQYYLQSFLDIDETKNSKGYLISLNIDETIVTTSNNSSGNATEENLTIIIKLEVRDFNNDLILIDQLSESRRISITSNLSENNSVKKIERENLIKNLSQKIKFKLLNIS